MRMIVLVWHWATADTRKGHACAVLRGVEMGLPLVVAGKRGKEERQRNGVRWDALYRKTVQQGAIPAESRASTVCMFP
jgi:hypothetical protein